METIRTMLLNLLLIVFLTMLLDLLLPEGDSRRYADLGAGLCMLLCMLRTVFSLLRGIM